MPRTSIVVGSRSCSLKGIGGFATSPGAIPERPKRFWEGLQSLEHAGLRATTQRHPSALPNRKVAYMCVPPRRLVSVALGRQRFVALARWNGGLIAREVKARAPSAAKLGHSLLRSGGASEIVDTAVAHPIRSFS